MKIEVFPLKIYIYILAFNYDQGVDLCTEGGNSSQAQSTQDKLVARKL